MSKIKILYPALTAALLLFITCFVQAQFPYSETFQNTTAPGLVVSGSARLTAAAGIDAPGQGYLRLTDNTNNNVGYVYEQNAFPAVYGLTISFEFYTWKSNANSTNQADGISFFLFDAGVNAFRPGGIGGSLGYANYYATPGMAKGFIGIGVDEFGNFSSATDGNKHGGPGQQRGAIAIRGPGNGTGATDYVYQTGVITSNAPYNIPFSGTGFSQRFPDPASPNYRKLKIILAPGSTLGPTAGFTVTVIMYKGGGTVTPVTLINNFDYPYAVPQNLKYGFASSTGGVTSYHEIRNMNINVTNTSALVAPTLANDAVTLVCQGQQALLDVTANDLSNNMGGGMNKATVDLDPATAGQQTSFTDPGKGTYVTDASGIVTFTPESGFSGTSTINYTANDTYGITATSSGTISVTASTNTGPSLTIIKPAGVCSPQKVDITSAAYKSNTTPGATYSYFNNLTDANNNANPIDATANTIAQSGTYYIRAFYNTCPTIKPIVVQIDAPPTTSNAGPDQAFCSSTGSQTLTLLATNPDVGTGAWTQVSGPTTSTISYPDAATSPVTLIEKGNYVYRWTVSSGACAASIDDIQASVGTVASNAGTNQTLCNGTSATLQGNAPAPATGLWSQVSGPAATITAPANPASTITGLVPGSSYVLSWRTTNGSCTSASQVTITSNAASVANGGGDQTIANATAATLNATAPATGSGAWTQISGPAAIITTPANAASTVTGLVAGNTYGFRWTLTDGTCVSTSDVIITDVLNTVANAGPDQSIGSVNQFTLSGNVPDAGNTGLWTAQSAPAGSAAIISQPTQPVTTVTNITKTGNYTFRWTISNSSLSNADDVTVNVSSVLPVQFVLFTGVQQNDQVQLRWETATESNNSRFNIERSLDGRSFAKIGVIDATESHVYSYNDAVQDLTGSVVYYRLQQVDQDGRTSYSGILKLDLYKTNAVSIWPNPFHTQINVNAYFSSAGIARITLYDNTGKQLQMLYRPVMKGYNTITCDQPRSVQMQLLFLELSKDGVTYRQKLMQQ